MKTVLLVVESLEPANLHRGFYNGFIQNGFIQNKRLNVIPLLCPRDVKFNWTVYNELILHTVNKFRVDSFFTLGGEQVSVETLKELQKKGIKTVTWQIDDPFVLTEDYGAETRKKLPFYNLIYTTNKVSIEKHYKKLGLSGRVKFFPFGYDPMFHQNLNLEKKYNVSFVGSNFPTRQRQYMSKFFHKVNLWGTSKNTRISHYSMVEILNQSKINLNFADQPANGVKCLKNRVTEVLGCEQFLLTETFPELKELFIPGKELDCFSTAEEMNDKISFYLTHDKKRENIARAGARKIKKYNYETLISKITEEILQ
jgi:spore maturation protein CgeB